MKLGFGSCQFCRGDFDEVPCGHEFILGPSRFSCTRKDGHDGLHVACGGDHEHSLAVWDNEGEGYYTRDLSEKMWLSCPFCGESDCGFVTVVECGFAVRCLFCGGKGPTRDYPDDARKAWNTRHSVWPADQCPEYQHLIELTDREEFYWEKDE